MYVLIVCINGFYKTDFRDIACTPNGFAQAVYEIGLSFIGVVALLFIVYGGYLILTSQGSPEQLSKGKSYITYAIIGMLLADGGYAFYQVLLLDIIKIPGFNR